MKVIFVLIFSLSFFFFSSSFITAFNSITTKSHKTLFPYHSQASFIHALFILPSYCLASLPFLFNCLLFYFPSLAFLALTPFPFLLLPRFSFFLIVFPSYALLLSIFIVSSLPRLPIFTSLLSNLSTSLFPQPAISLFLISYYSHLFFNLYAFYSFRFFSPLYHLFMS